MARSSGIVRAAIVQARPIPFDIDAGIAAVADHINVALEDGARMVAFGETFLGGYPIWLDEAPEAALWNHPGAKALHAILMRTAIVAGDTRLAAIQALCDKAKAVVVVGAHERVRNSLYNTMFILSPDAAPLTHRKLVPTHGERLIWGATLGVAQTPQGRIGGLICWEHWMPLARAAMHHQNESIHVAQWPTVRDTYLIASRHYAFEGRCFVLAAGTVLWRDDLMGGLERVGGGAAAQELLSALPAGQLQSGASAIIGPDASVLAQAGSGEEVLMAELDDARRLEEFAALDTDGHYARPDIFQLRVDTRVRDGVAFERDIQVLASYTAIIIDEPTLIEARLSVEQAEAMRSALGQALRDAFGRERQIASAPGPNVLRVRYAIVQVETSNVALNAATSLIIGAVDYGSLALEAEVVDSVTGEQRAALTWARGAKATNVLGAYSSTGNARALAPDFARRLAMLISPEAPS